MTRRADHRSAFTLLEMMVALALMAILSSGLYASLHIGFRARTLAEATIAPVRATMLALELLRRDIESAPPPTGILASAFVGQDAKAEGTAADADTLVFCSTAEDVAGDQPATRKIELALVPAAEGSDSILVRRVTANLLAPSTPTPVEEVLCRDVMSFNLRYFDGTAWVDSWDSGTRDNTLPIAVEARLKIRILDPAQPDADGYELVREFLLPCGSVPSDTSTAVSLPSSN